MPQKDELAYQAVTDTSLLFDVKYSPKDKSITNSGGDFMSSPRELLGEYIKGKLISEGLLKYGDLITDEMLDEYGSGSLKVWFIENQKAIYLEF